MNMMITEKVNEATQLRASGGSTTDPKSSTRSSPGAKRIGGKKSTKHWRNDPQIQHVNMDDLEDNEHVAVSAFERSLSVF
jgi:hypothetical protein